MRLAPEIVAYAQAAYFALTGVWPLVHVRSFMAVTGPKVDVWLVRTVGVLVTVIGAVIGMAARRHAIGPEIVTLSIGSAAALAAVDVIYVARRVIARIYLADAVAEVVLIAGWVIAWWGNRAPY
jgi:hypothetical protein